jgi:hypothetical protein
VWRGHTAQSEVWLLSRVGTFPANRAVSARACVEPPSWGLPVLLAPLCACCVGVTRRVVLLLSLTPSAFHVLRHHGGVQGHRPGDRQEVSE